jgi:hypothetical protein
MLFRDSFSQSIHHWDEVSPEDCNNRSTKNEIENWLYDEGYETTKQEYERKLSELKKLGNPLEARAYQFTHRPGAIDSLKKQIELKRQGLLMYET